MLTGILGLVLFAWAATTANAKSNALHPAVTLPATWGATLTLIAACEGLGYYQVSAPAALVFLAGATSYIVGALAIESIARQSPLTYRPINFQRLRYNRLALACIVTHVALFPIWWIDANNLAGPTSDIAELAYRIRLLTTTSEETLGHLSGNYLVAGIIITPILFWGAINKQANPYLTLATIIPWLFANLLTNGRSALVQMSLVFLYLWFAAGKRLTATFLVALALFLIAILTIGAGLVGKNDADFDGGTSLLLASTLENFLDYVLQGPILFSKYLESPMEFVPTWDALLVPCSLLNRIGMCDVEPLHQPYLVFASDGRSGNVYSIYLSILPKYGWAGLFLFMAAYGAWFAFHVHRSKNGSLIHTLMAAFLFSASILSVFNDQFGPGLNLYGKLVILIWISIKVFGGRKEPIPQAI